MLENILDNFRKGFGFSKEEWKETTTYTESYQIAQKVTMHMRDSDIVGAFTQCADSMMLEYDSLSMMGPTGHCYKVNRSNFRNQYPNYLQSF